MLKTEWEVWHYDVWGNEEDGYDVNDRHCICRHLTVMCAVKTYNVGTNSQFSSAEIPDKVQLDMFGVASNNQGDDTHYYFEDDNGKPLGEMICVSHESLSPIKLNPGFLFHEE
jgi:hypothetical protein